MKRAKRIFIRMRRYFLFFLQYMLYEKPRGLDFTMRDVEVYQKNGGLIMVIVRQMKSTFKRFSKGYPLRELGCWMLGVERGLF